jgi:hypothetical protein
VRTSCGVYAWLRGGRWTLSWPSRGDVSVFAAYPRGSLVAYAVRTAVNGGSELSTCIPRAAHSHDNLLTVLELHG